MAEQAPKSVLFVCLGETCGSSPGPAFLGVGWAPCARGCALGEDVGPDGGPGAPLPLRAALRRGPVRLHGGSPRLPSPVLSPSLALPVAPAGTAVSARRGVLTLRGRGGVGGLLLPQTQHSAALGGGVHGPGP